jgi:hypothetical protein
VERVHFSDLFPPLPFLLLEDVGAVRCAERRQQQQIIDWFAGGRIELLELHAMTGAEALLHPRWS